MTVSNVQVPGKPLLVTQEPPPDEDLKELQDLRDSFTGSVVALSWCFVLLPQAPCKHLPAACAFACGDDISVVAEDTLSRKGLVDKKGNIVPDSHFIFTALPNADFMAESAFQLNSLALASVHLLLHWQTA